MSPGWFLFFYLALYAGCVVFAVWRKKRKSGRFPIPDDVLLLRRAGETLERRLRYRRPGRTLLLPAPPDRNAFLRACCASCGCLFPARRSQTL